MSTSQDIVDICCCDFERACVCGCMYCVVAKYVVCMCVAVSIAVVVAGSVSVAVSLSLSRCCPFMYVTNRARTSMYICAYTYMWIYISQIVHVYLYIFAHKYIRTQMCIFTCTHTHTHRQEERTTGSSQAALPELCQSPWEQTSVVHAKRDLHPPSVESSDNESSEEETDQR